MGYANSDGGRSRFEAQPGPASARWDLVGTTRRRERATMVRLKLRTPRESGAPHRLESDRETLHFPQGGVFGPASSHSSTKDAEVVDGVDQSLQSMRRQLDELRREVDASLHLPSEPPRDWTPPHRAA